MAIQSLATLSAGQFCYINTIELQGLFKRRILDLGVIPGTVVQCIRHSPSGSPIAYKIRGATIAIRKEDASQIKVTL
ncbi:MULTISPECIES: FeoA family protein [Anaerosinus]|uniref:FeoA family protein n=1 Tax=Selenobaculum gibii TaxID=3054208 RepID=A0A9Y2ER58_9FIRM|nr:FeoA family protein [Selenobaculum gbiensis]WIW70802.1 FeoA family protein [Selenobaculum gbiensis]